MTDIRWVSANDFIEAQTKNLERHFHSSRPKPRNRAMGFRDDPKKGSRMSLSEMREFGWDVERNGSLTYLRHHSGRVRKLPRWMRIDAGLD